MSLHPAPLSPGQSPLEAPQAPLAPENVPKTPEALHEAMVKAYRRWRRVPDEEQELKQVRLEEARAFSNRLRTVFGRILVENSVGSIKPERLKELVADLSVIRSGFLQYQQHLLFGIRSERRQFFSPEAVLQFKEATIALDREDWECALADSEDADPDSIHSVAPMNIHLSALQKMMDTMEREAAELAAAAVKAPEVSRVVPVVDHRATAIAGPGYKEIVAGMGQVHDGTLVALRITEISAGSQPAGALPHSQRITRAWQAAPPSEADVASSQGPGGLLVLPHLDVDVDDGPSPSGGAQTLSSQGVKKALGDLPAASPEKAGETDK